MKRVKVPSPFDAAAQKHLQQLRTRVAYATWECERRWLQRFFRWLNAGHYDWRTLTRQDIESYLLSINATATTRYKSWSTLRGFYAFHKIVPCPTDGITFKLPPRRLPHVPAQGDLKSAIEKITSPSREVAFRTRLIAELAYGSGLRRCELSRLDTADLDLTNRSIYVHGKGGTNRIVPLTAKAAKAAKEYLAVRPGTTGPLLMSTTVRRRLSAGSIGMSIKRSTGFNTHLFRHSCATHMLESGCSIRIIGELLGHRFLTTTQHYTHINKVDLARVVERHHPRKQEKKG